MISCRNFKSRKLISALLIAVAGLLGCQNQNNSLKETILYTTLRPDNLDIYLFEKGNPEPKRLTNYQGLDYNAAFSPEGEWIVYTSDRAGNTDLFAMRTSETDEKAVRLTAHKGMDDQAAFSPDGKTIVFMSSRGGYSDLWQMPFNPDSPSLTEEQRAFNLTNTDFYGEFNPAFSPDGKQIAFSSNKLPYQEAARGEGIRDFIRTDVFVMDADGKNTKQLTDTTATKGPFPYLLYGSPAWSNDGEKIYFYKAEAAVISDRIGGLWEIDLKTSKINVLTDASKFVSSLTVTADGKLLYVESPSSSADPRPRETGAHEGAYLVMMNADGGDKQILTDAKNDYSRPRVNSKNQIVAHGSGSLEGLNLMSSGIVFSRAETFKDVSLSDRKVFVAGVRAYAPNVSADGKEIFTTEWIGRENEELWGFSPIVSSDVMGNNYRTVFKPDKCFAWTPIVSRDKQWLVYACGARFAEADKKVDIWRVKLDGSEAINLTENLQGNSAFPDLSQDGKRIVFRGGHDGNKEIYLMNFDGKNLRRMTNTPQTETMPVISPDGKSIAYVRLNPATHNMNIYLQTVDDPNDAGKPLEPERLNLFSEEVHPRFSPDGKWIVFVTSRTLTKDEWTSGFHPQPFGEIFAKQIDSDEPAVQLTDDKWEDGITPSWAFINKE